MDTRHGRRSFLAGGAAGAAALATPLEALAAAVERSPRSSTVAPHRRMVRTVRSM